jgi:hypothetical protein
MTAVTHSVPPHAFPSPHLSASSSAFSFTIHNSLFSIILLAVCRWPFLSFIGSRRCLVRRGAGGTMVVVPI